jgi:hypothetical protein
MMMLSPSAVVGQQALNGKTGTKGYSADGRHEGGHADAHLPERDDSRHDDDRQFDGTGQKAAEGNVQFLALAQLERQVADLAAHENAQDDDDDSAENLKAVGDEELGHHLVDSLCLLQFLFHDPPPDNELLTAFILQNTTTRFRIATMPGSTGIERRWYQTFSGGSAVSATASARIR